MKTFRLSLLAISLVSGLLVSCNKDEDVNNNLVSAEDAADLVSLTVAANSSGLASTLNDMATQTAEAVESESMTKSTAGDYSKDTTITRSNPQGSIISYSYTLHYSYALTVSNLGIPQTMTAAYEYSGSFDAPRMASSNSGEGNIVLTGLELLTPEYTANGTFERNGSFESRVRNRNTSNSRVMLSFADLQIDKSDLTIQSGTAEINISGSISSLGSYDFNATLVFNGDNTATLTVKGVVYTIDLITGDVTAV